MFSEWVEDLQILSRYWPTDESAPIWGWDDETVFVGVNRDALAAGAWARWVGKRHPTPRASPAIDGGRGRRRVTPGSPPIGGSTVDPDYQSERPAGIARSCGVRPIASTSCPCGRSFASARATADEPGLGQRHHPPIDARHDPCRCAVALRTHERRASCPHDRPASTGLILRRRRGAGPDP